MFKKSYKILFLFTLFVAYSTCINYKPIQTSSSSSEIQKCIFKTDDGKTINLTPLENINYSYYDTPSFSQYYYGICSPNTYCQKLLNTDVEVESCGVFETNGPNVTMAIGMFDGATVQVYTEVTNLFYYQNVGVETCPGNGQMIMQLELNCNYYFNFTVHTVYQARTCHTIISIGTIHACEVQDNRHTIHI
ncbi:hypothetical protein RB653_006519 [Dictyostelium firmibasis]|uniref:MRH domain-containing protein n=1 Tax=Dictyostelium firmibasis TaxID=79012 RepID=A0AAN7Z098_9MYCE